MFYVMFDFTIFSHVLCHVKLLHRYGIPSDKAVWDRMLEKYVSETNAQEKSKLLRGLASVKDPWLIYRLIEVHMHVERR